MSRGFVAAAGGGVVGSFLVSGLLSAAATGRCCSGRRLRQVMCPLVLGRRAGRADAFLCSPRDQEDARVADDDHTTRKGERHDEQEFLWMHRSKDFNVNDPAASRKVEDIVEHLGIVN